MTNKSKWWSAVIAAMLTEKIRDAEKRIENDKYGSVRGHVVGRDNGADWRRNIGDPNKRQPRNAQCVCNSGKKAKKCCVTYAEANRKVKTARAEAIDDGSE